jgi:hypothetical protein
MFTVKGLLLLDNNGKRVLAHYYNPDTLGTLKEQTAFERRLFRKTAKTNVEVLVMDALPILYRLVVLLFQRYS